MRALVLALGALTAAQSLAAQADCSPRASSREADLFAHVLAPLAYSPAQSPWVEAPGSIQIGLEGGLFPDIGDRLATPTTCRPGKGPEDWNLASGFLRPRVSMVLGNAIMLEVSWMPPTHQGRIRPNLWSFSIARTVPLGEGGAFFSGRFHATIGHLNAPITCSSAAIRDPISPCFGGQRSNDKLSPNVFGIELAVARPLAAGRLRPYAGGGYSILHPRFRAHFRDASGQLDDQKREVNLRRWTLFAGGTLAVVPRLQLSTEGYYSVGDVLTGRVRVTISLGRKVE